MDESWEKAMESALEGHAESSSSSPRTLTLDGAVKCLHGRLPPPSLLERFRNLEHLSIANIGLSSLESFPKLRILQRLTLSDNRIAGGLEFLVEAGLDSLRDLDLSNNRIQSVEDLAPLANLRLVSLDLYECPVTRVKDYRSRVFGMIPSLKYLDKMDADGNERPETDDEEEEEEEYDEEEIDGEDPGNSEIDGEDQAKTVNGSGAVGNGNVDENEESDADEEETETGRNGNGSIHHLNGFHVAAVGAQRDDDEDAVDEEEEEEEEEEDDDYEEEDEDLGEGEGEEINEDEEGEEEDVVEAQDVVDSDEEDGGDGVEEGDGGEDEDEDEDEDEVEGEPGSTDRLVSTEGEIDGHEQGEEDDENAGEIGEADDDQGLGEDQDSEEDGEDGESEDEEDLDGEFLVQPIPQQERAGGGRGEIDACNEEDEDEEDEVDDTEQYRLSNAVSPPQPSSPSQQPNKRRREEDGDDSVDEGLRSSKHH